MYAIALLGGCNFDCTLDQHGMPGKRIGTIEECLRKIAMEFYGLRF